MMHEKYSPGEVEARQQQRWAAAHVFEVDADRTRQKFYCLEMLPYPSGRIHMGHVRNYSIGDAVACFKRMSGLNVLHPMGWDAFGMPAENAAIKHHARPDTWTFENIDAMRVQLKQMGFSYDWRREFATCAPDYYRWNQWFFLQMWKRGLLYRKNATVNWCPECNTSLANEQAEGGYCWRHETTPVEPRELEQWFIKVADYAGQLLDDLKQLEGGWPERVRTMQRNWIGRSEGAEVDFALENDPSARIRIFTTRIDTIFGANAVILAPEHPLMDAWMAAGRMSPAVREFVERQRAVSRDERIAEGAEKLGVPTGCFAINPFNGERLPVWTANFVLTGYGTGTIMCVPAHDERDFEFSQQYTLPIRRVIISAEATEDIRAPVTEAFISDDERCTVVNSGQWSGLCVPDAQRGMTAYAQEHGFGQAQTHYKIRDWGVSRQRAWGTPIPFVHCPQCGIVPVPEDQLPVMLPADLNFNAAGPPLAEHEAFVNTTCPNCSGLARRDTDTMDTFVDSSWYYFRYCDPHNTGAPFDPETIGYWTPVELYIGGIEHAVLHLIYTRVWTKIMRDLGLIVFDEPVTRLLTQGMVCLASYRCEEHDYLYPQEVINGTCSFCGRPVVVGRVEKMSKSKKNTIDPDDMIQAYGADTVRLFMLFAAPPEKDVEWSEGGVEGSFRFLNRVWRIVYKWQTRLAAFHGTGGECSPAARALRRKTHQTIKRVTDAFRDEFHFNTAVAALMELANELYAFDGRLTGEATEADLFVLKEGMEALVTLMVPFTPHIAEELWQALGHDALLVVSPWPQFNPDLAREEELEIPVQLNGKIVARLMVPADTPDDALTQMALAHEKVRTRLDGRQVVKTIVVPKRLVNIVTR